ncbi:hypothetical protein ACIQF8_14025 [Pseudarthrobacter sp. NPDC092184]|uniref:hypothetical protein n=1 Tax=unclassified Pseudarthrobacter TaxID=2647000 RepID=UPI0038175004
MGISFSKTVEFEPNDQGEFGALRLEAELARLFADGSQYAEMRFKRFPWVISDEDSSTARGKTVGGAFQEFRKHDLTPNCLRIRKTAVAGPFLEMGVTFEVRYWIAQNRVEVDLWGPDRITLDGVAAFFERMGERLQRPLTPEERALLTSPPEKSSWLSRAWRDHAVMLVIAVVGPIGATLLGLWLGLPK